ncbi:MULTISPECIES: hypothetical protein [unclassified Shinella]|uniref:hypothetical protein n=1 Tax=unclassified Shinella TaxID=2643062 RepID=UPI00225DC893|nr:MULTISPECIES: hypothetical protein [unclassified Shinella]MCO5137348.1 hypothetical protein [Shinella sp.]MDC7257476.1 hypothetical protein [Shinella sp. YE25]CAI0340376.1 hypothetical protein SHINE37_44244 [Rhizobiaceae bacterium]
MKPEPLGTLMRAVYSWESGQPTTIAALKFMALLALRLGEVDFLTKIQPFSALPA